jgi:hypothetical protein
MSYIQFGLVWKKRIVYFSASGYLQVLSFPMPLLLQRLSWGITGMPMP